MSLLTDISERRFICFAAVFFSLSLARASVFTLPTIESSQTDAIFKTFGANFAFRPLESANDLGAVWGFYFVPVPAPPKLQS
jgi:hypothetical protein